MRAGDPIPESLLSRPVAGLNRVPGTLRDHPDYERICEEAARVPVDHSPAVPALVCDPRSR